MATVVAARVLAALGSAFNERAGALLEHLVDGLTKPLADIDDMVQPTARGWARAVDLDETTIPAWYGNATGTRVPGGLTVEQQRDYVRDRASWRRGSPAAVKGAVAQLLDPTTSRRVDLRERDGSPWRLGLIVWAASRIGVTDEQLLAAATSQKPVGIVLTDVEVLEGATWDHIVAEHGTWEDVLADFTAWDASPDPNADTVRYHVPEEGTEI